MASPEFDSSVFVNTTTHTEAGITIEVESEEYRPRELRPEQTDDHEAIHAALGEATLVTIVPGPGYNGKTEFDSYNVVAALGPHFAGAKGTSWDVFTAEVQGYNPQSLRSTVHAAVSENHAEIVEISDELNSARTLNRLEIQSAKKRAIMKKKYGEKASITIHNRDGQTKKIYGVKVEEDKIAIPETIVDFANKSELEDKTSTQNNFALMTNN